MFPSAMRRATESGGDAIFPLLVYNFEDIACLPMILKIHIFACADNFGDVGRFWVWFSFGIKTLEDKGWPMELYQRCLI